MAIDPSIILGIKPAQLPQTDPLERYAKIAGIQGAMGQQDLQAIQLQQARQGMDADQRLRALYASNPNPTADQVSAIDPKQGMAYRKLLGDAELQRSTIDKNKADTGLKQREVIDKTMGEYRNALSGVTDPATAAAWVNAQHDDPVLSKVVPVSREQALASIPQDPTQLTQWVQKNALGMTKFIEQNKPHVTTQDLGGTSQLVATPGLGGAPTVLSAMPKTQTPDSVAVDARVRSEGALNRGQAASEAAANRANHLLVAGLNPDGTTKSSAPAGTPIDLSTVSKEDLAAAHRYRSDGTLPPNIGRGVQGAAESRRIRSIAAQLDETAGGLPEDARARQLAFKGDVNAVNALTKREAQVGANVRNFDFNADQVLQLSNKVDRSGIPAINGWLNAGKRSVAGNPDIAAFDVAVKTTVNEFAQIVSGTTAGATTEGEKQKAEKLLSAAQTPEQIKSVINQMRIESANRMKSFADQKLQSMPGAKRTDAVSAQPNPGATTKVDSLSQADPAKYSGQVATGDDGIKYKSDGKRWVRQ